jgi:hypothetical protein
MLKLLTCILAFGSAEPFCYADAHVVTAPQKLKFCNGTAPRFITRIEFDNHYYLVLSDLRADSGDCMIHDPDCPCRQSCP